MWLGKNNECHEGRGQDRLDSRLVSRASWHSHFWNLWYLLVHDLDEDTGPMGVFSVLPRGELDDFHLPLRPIATAVLHALVSDLITALAVKEDRPIRTV